MGLLDFIKTVDPRKVRAVEVQKGDDQVTLLESTRHCFMPLVIPAARGSSSAAATKILAPTKGGQKDVAEEDACLELADPDEGTAMVRQSEEEVVTEQFKKVKKRRLQKQGDIMPTGSRLLAREQSATPSVAPPSQESESFMDLSAQASIQIRTTVGSSSTLIALVDTVAATTTSTKAKLAADVNPDLAGPSQLQESKGSDDSFYELATFDPFEAKRWHVPRWNITNDSLLDDGFSCRAARQICLGSEVRSRAEHKLELKEKLNAKYAVRDKLLEEKDSEIPRKSALTVEVSVSKVHHYSKDHDISLLDSCATHLESALNDAQVACTEAGTKITSLASERDRLVSEDFKEKMEVQQEEQA
ncbi:hypothetical protein Tco_0170260 [Tanacetum coccineum]